MPNLQSFFIFCSGANESILKRSPSDYNKYASIGATIFFTGVLAFIASAFAVYTIFGSIIAAIFFGLVWGLMIFNLDRYIVSSMKNSGSGLRNFFSATPRLILAIIIAVVISKPLELKIFQSEIGNELTSMQQERYKEQEALLKDRFEVDIALIKSEIAIEEAKIVGSQTNFQRLNQQALAEADGTGGSQLRNMGPIYKAKKAEAEKAEAAHLALVSTTQPIIDGKRTQLNELELQQATALQELEKVPLTGFAAQLDALGRLSDKSHTIWLASLFIMLLFIAIETTPIFVKLISRDTPYDYSLDKVEHRYRMDHKRVTTLLALDTNTQLEYETKTKEHQNRAVISAENELFTDALNKKITKEKENAVGWVDILKRKRLGFD